jgi:hypothetical protein
MLTLSVAENEQFALHSSNHYAEVLLTERVDADRDRPKKDSPSAAGSIQEMPVDKRNSAIQLWALNGAMAILEDSADD